MTKIILDTDIGTDVDDALCLGLALAEPAVELIGITTVSGDTDCRARIARKLARLAGQPQIPVFAGAQDPSLPVRKIRSTTRKGFSGTVRKVTGFWMSPMTILLRKKALATH